jgi:DNA adenine methylase
MAGTTLKPPFAYYGGKTTLAPKIAALLPEHDHYVEPFAGSLAVLLAKDPAKIETVNDLDGHLTTFWRVLRERPEDLERACALTPHSRLEFEDCKTFAGDDLEIARRVWVVLTQGRRKSLEKSSAWITERKATIGLSRAVYLEKYIQRFAPVAARLKTVGIEARDALEIISEYGAEPTVCIYADPPYLGSVRHSGYRLEMLGDDLHVRLAAALAECKAAVVLSGYSSPLYEDLYAGWHRLEMKAPTKLSGAAAPNEVLWSNVPLGTQMEFDLGGIA